MKTLKTSTILAVAGVLLVAASASAQLREAVRADSGKAWVSTNGNCVQTKWDGLNGCADANLELRTVYFDFDSAVLTPAAKAKLDVLSNTLHSGGSANVKIVGYADKIGNASYNVNLSQRRANAVGAYLVSKGVSVAPGSEIRGLGATSSLSQCQGVRGAELKACLWRDRRVEVEIL